MNVNELFEGEKIKIRGREYIVPGLSFGQIERLSGLIESIQKGGETSTLSKEMVQGIISITHAALSRNYPEITEEEVKDMVDTRNMMPIFSAIMGASGFKLGGNGAKGTPMKRNSVG